MPDVKVGVQIMPQHGSMQQLREAWKCADDMGIDSLWTWDHFTYFSISGDPDGAHFEGFSVLAAMAESTEQASIGSLVACNAFRNPNLTADMARTIDHISGGRFILGLGSGWFERDFEEYGYDFKDAPARLRDLAAALPVIKDRLSKLNPGPVNGKLPIMIGGNGETVTLRLVAEHADIWNGFGDPAEVGRLNRVLDEWCATVERDRSSIERSILFNDPGSIWLLDAYAENGMTHVIYGIEAPEFDFASVEKLIVWRDNNQGK